MSKFSAQLRSNGGAVDIAKKNTINFERLYLKIKLVTYDLTKISLTRFFSPTCTCMPNFVVLGKSVLKLQQKPVKVKTCDLNDDDHEHRRFA